MEEVIIWEERGKVVRQVIFGAMMLAVSVFIMIGGFQNREMLYAIPGVLGTLLFGASFIFILRGLFVPRPLMKINDKGITDLSTLTSFGLVEWDEIDSVTMTKRFRQQFIDIAVLDDEKVIKRLPKYRQYLLKLNVESKQALVSIPLGTAKISTDDVRDLLQRKLAEHGRKLMIG